VVAVEVTGGPTVEFVPGRRVCKKNSFMFGFTFPDVHSLTG